MSINVSGVAPAVPVNALPGAAVRQLAPASHFVTGTSNIANDVQADVGRAIQTGTHKVTSFDPTLNDSFSAPGVHVGQVCRNVSDGSEGIVTSNTTTKLVAALTGGALNLWTAGDQYDLIKQAAASLQPQPAQFGTDLTIYPGIDAIVFATFSATVVGSTVSTPTDVTASTAVLPLIDLNAPAPDQPPTIISTPAPIFFTGNSATYDMTQHVIDDALSPVTYSLSNTLPSWMSFDTNTGVLTYDGTGEVLSPSTDDVIQLDTIGTATAGIEFNSSGEEFSTPGGGGGGGGAFTESRGFWLDFGDVSEVWIERTVNSGTLDWTDGGAGRLSLSASRQFGIIRSTNGTDTANVTFDFYSAASGGVLLTSVDLDFQATLSP